MAPTTLSIHTSSAHMSILTPFLDQVDHVSVAGHWLFLEAFYIDTLFYVLTHLEVDRGWL